MTFCTTTLLFTVFLLRLCCAHSVCFKFWLIVGHVHRQTSHEISDVKLESQGTRIE